MLDLLECADTRSFSGLVFGVESETTVPNLPIGGDPNAIAFTFVLTNSTTAALGLTTGTAQWPEPPTATTTLYLDLTGLGTSQLAGLQIHADGWAAAPLPGTSKWTLIPTANGELAAGESVRVTVTHFFLGGAQRTGRVMVDFFNVGTIPYNTWLPAFTIGNPGQGTPPIVAQFVGYHELYQSTPAYPEPARDLTWSLQNTTSAPVLQDPKAPAKLTVTLVGFASDSDVETKMNVAIADQRGNHWLCVPYVAKAQPGIVSPPPAWVLTSSTTQLLGNTPNGDNTTTLTLQAMTTEPPGIAVMLVQYENLPGISDGCFQLTVDRTLRVRIDHLAVTPPGWMTSLPAPEATAVWTVANVGTVLLDGVDVTTATSWTTPTPLAAGVQLTLTAYGVNAQDGGNHNVATQSGTSAVATFTSTPDVWKLGIDPFDTDNLVTVVAFSPTGARAFSLGVASGVMQVIDTTTDQIVIGVPIGQTVGTPQLQLTPTAVACARSPTGDDRVFVLAETSLGSLSDRQLYVIDVSPANTVTFRGAIEVGWGGSAGMWLAPNGRLYLFTMQPGQSMSDPPTIGYVATADATPVFTPIGTNDWLTAPQDSALCGKPDGSVLYIAAVAPGQIGGTAIFAVALTAHAFPPSLMLGDFGPSTIVMLRHAVSRDGSRLYVQIHTTAGPATTIDVYDTSDFNAPVTTIDFGMALTGAMAMSPDTDFLYVGLQTYAVAIVDTRLQRIGIELSTVPPGQITWSDSALSPLPGPRGIAVSPDGATAYAAGAAFTRISRVLSVG